MVPLTGMPPHTSSSASSTAASVSVSEIPEALPTLTKADAHYLEHREQLVTDGLRASMAAAQALYEIYSYKEGILWRAKGFPAFGDYCHATWGYNPTYAYRLRECGAFVHELSDSQLPIGSWPTHESQVRPLLKLPQADRLRVWTELTKSTKPGELTAKQISAHTTAYAEKKKIKLPRQREHPTRRAQRALAAFMTAVHALPAPKRAPLLPLIAKLERLLNT